LESSSGSGGQMVAEAQRKGIAALAVSRCEAVNT
jgi:hypothetical protein